MMNRLDRYVASHVLSAVAVVLLIVVGIDLMSALIDGTGDLSDRFTFYELLQYLVLTTPRRLYEMVPISALIGCLIGLGSLASHSELTVMRAAGYSTARIIGSVFKPVLLLIVLTMLLGQFVVPVAEKTAVTQRAIAMAQSGKARLDEGAWHRDGNEFIHIVAVEQDNLLHGITRYKFDDNGHLAKASYADEGTPVAGGWELRNIDSTAFTETGTQAEHIDSETWKTGLTPELLSVITVEPDDLSMTGLWQYSNYLAEQNISASTYLIAFWKKALLPFSIAGLVLIGVSFIFGPLRSVTAGQRIISGVLAGVVFKFAQDMLGPASAVFGFAPFIAVLVPILICFLIGALLLRKAG